MNVRQRVFCILVAVAASLLAAGGCVAILERAAGQPAGVRLLAFGGVLVVLAVFVPITGFFVGLARSAS